MKKDDIIRMALEAGLEGFRGEHPVGWGEYAIDTEIIEKFAVLVATAERERCIHILKTTYIIDDGEDYAQLVLDRINENS